MKQKLELTYTVDDDFISISPKYEQFQLAKLESGTNDQRIKWAEMICKAVNCHEQLVEALKNLVTEITQPGYPLHSGMTIIYLDKAKAALKNVENK